MFLKKFHWKNFLPSKNTKETNHPQQNDNHEQKIRMSNTTDYQLKLSLPYVNDIIIDYGIIPGNENIFFIKVGLNGNIYGYEDKYLKIATRLNTEYGWSVIVASNPSHRSNSIEQGMNLIGEYASQQKSQNQQFQNYKVFYMGFSNGAALGLEYCHLYPQISKALLINGPLIINPHKLVSGIRNFKGNKMHIVYGDKDPSFPEIRFFKELESETVKFHILENIDHNFTGEIEKFKQLPETYLFESKFPPVSLTPLHFLEQTLTSSPHGTSSS